MYLKWSIYILLALSFLHTQTAPCAPPKRQKQALPIVTGIFNKSFWVTQHDLFALHAIPKCGSHLIERAIQLMTDKKSIQSPVRVPILQKACLNNNIVRTFEIYNPHILRTLRGNQHKLIALIRDPRDALISLVFYLRSFAFKPENHLKRDFYIVRPDFDLLTLNHQIKALIAGGHNMISYIQFYRERIQWALQPGNLMVKYEDLVGAEGGGNDISQQLAILSIAQYIHLNLTESRFNHVLENLYVNFGNEIQDGRVFKRSSIGNWKTFFSPQHKALFKKLMGQDLITLGYEKDFNW